jgi:UDP-GlcNAc3NAcA epimerase
MTKAFNLMSIVGARPQFVKASALSRAFPETFQDFLVHTGQHYDSQMSQIFFDELGLAHPDVNLEIGSGNHGEQTGKMLGAIEAQILRVQPDCVLVYGDTNSTLAGALAAVKLNIPLAHVEAGLRSFNRRMPEEINRVLSDHAADLLLCPTDTAVENLRKEGITAGVHNVGDVMYDALLHNLQLAEQKSHVLAEMGLEPGAYALATVHRAANTDEPARLQGIMAAFGRLDTPVVFPIHPRTRKTLETQTIVLPDNVRAVPPVGYLDMLTLEQNAACILTDSGGVQKEAYLLGVRCITLRDETEWVETVQAGWNVLVGGDVDAIVAAYHDWFPAGDRPDYFGDGHAAEKIVPILESMQAK